MYISEIGQDDLLSKVKAALPGALPGLIEKGVETYQKYKDEKKPKAAAPPARLTMTQEPPPSGAKWVMPVVIGTVAVGGLGFVAWLLLRKKAG